jgi:glutaminase
VVGVDAIQARPRDVGQRPGPGTDEVGSTPPLRASAARWLQRILERHRDLHDGAVATYIPELARVDPDLFGIAIVTVDGTTYEAGDTRHRFTLQSMSKPLVYAAILDALGEEHVRRHIGVEPSGEAFNSITLDRATGIPPNPMVNAGAITAAGLVPGIDDEHATRNLIDAIARFTGRPLEVDEDVYRSERDTGHRNRAIAHLLRSTGALVGDSDMVVERYFRQCAISVDTHDLAVIAATLAAGGHSPLTGMRAASEATVRSVLSVMATCGMYDGAGEWMYTVGLPAKSGVCGGILAVLPGQLGIGVFSPRLDERGNSVRGVAVCRDLSSELGLHLVGAARRSAPRIRRRCDIAGRHSKRRRGPLARALLAEEGARSVVLELQGHLSLLTVEAVSRAASGSSSRPSTLILDLRRVTGFDPLMAPLLADLAVELAGRDGEGLAWSDVGEHGEGVDAVDEVLAQRGLEPLPRFAELDAAIEWAEDMALRRADVDTAPVSVTLADHELLQGMGEAELEALATALDARQWTAGERVVRRGDPAQELFLVARGTLSVSVEADDGRPRRLSTLSAGMTFGEFAFLGTETRTADVVADSDVESWVLTAERFRALTARDPALGLAILERLLRVVGRTARSMTEEIAALAS